MPTAQILSVLIVEDNPDVAETLTALVKLDGHAVRTAFHPEEALRLARAAPPDVVVTDIGLPGMNGFALARELSATLPRKPLLIAVSGYGHMGAECVAAGIDHYLVKPVDPAALRNLLGPGRAAESAD
jgi:CheY-like chemotaxis protein